MKRSLNLNPPQPGRSAGSSRVFERAAIPAREVPESTPEFASIPLPLARRSLRSFVWSLGLIGALLLSRPAQAAILSIAPRDASYDDRFHDRTGWRGWTEEESRHYMVQQMLVRFEGEAYRKPYADALAQWERSAPPAPWYLRGYGQTTFWRKRPHRLRTARSPRPGAGIPVRGLTSEAALGFVSDFRAILGVATAPQHVYLAKSVQSGMHHHKWFFVQFPPGPEKADCRGCDLKVTIDLRTMQIVEIENALIDLPVRGLAAPTTDGREARKRFLDLHPDGWGPLRGEPATFTYAQDRYGDVSLVWEMQTTRLSMDADSNRLGDYRTWVALDAQNWSFRGYDIADDLGDDVLDATRSTDWDLTPQHPMPD